MDCLGLVLIEGVNSVGRQGENGVALIVRDTVVAMV